MSYMPVLANTTNWFSFIAQFVVWYNFHTFYDDHFMCIININVKHLRVPWKICKTTKYMENYLSSIFHWLDHIARKMFHKSINKSKWTSLISSVGWILCNAVFPFNGNWLSGAFLIIEIPKKFASTFHSRYSRFKASI